MEVPSQHSVAIFLLLHLIQLLFLVFLLLHLLLLVHGDMMYKKNPQGVTVSSIDKRIYKTWPPYGRPVTIKSESKMIGHKLTYDKNNNSQVFKALTMASHNNPSVYTIPSTNCSCK